MSASEAVRLIGRAEKALRPFMEAHEIACQCPLCQAWARVYAAMRSIERPGYDLSEPWSKAARGETTHVAP